MDTVSRLPDASKRDLLAGATFADAFSIDVAGRDMDAQTAAERVFAAAPAWVNRLLWLRDVLVRPLGLKGTGDERLRAADYIGFFPCLSRTPACIVMGFDDAHLDFRVAVDVAGIDGVDGMSRVTATTLVRPHNLFGRAYLACVMPFHKLIVPAMLRRLRQPALVQTDGR